MSMLSFIICDSKWFSVRGCESVQVCFIYSLFTSFLHSMESTIVLSFCHLFC